MSVSRRSFLAARSLATAGVLMSMSGCGSSSSSNSSSDSSSSSSTKATEFTGAPAYQSTNYSPLDMAGGSGLMIGAIWHVYEGLYELNMNTYEVYPGLASGDPVKVSDTEYEVSLRDGAKYSDGSSVTIDDVVFCIDAACGKVEVAGKTAGTISPMLDFIDSVAKKDDTTVTIKLKYAFNKVADRLTLAKIFPKDSTKEDMEKGPLGSGPYDYVRDGMDGNDGGTIKFVKNENYNGKYAAPVESMTWNILTDNTARTTAIVDGTVMVAESVPDANVEQVEGAGATVEYKESFGQPFLMFNCRKAPFNDKRVRQAFYYAINYDKLIKNCAEGHGVMITGYLPESHQNYHKASTVYTYDPDKAKSLLEAAGASGTSLTLLVNDNWVKGLSAQIQEDLKAVGLDVTLDTQKITWSNYAESADILPYDVMLTPGDPSCFGMDPDLLMSWWYSDNAWTQGRSCWKYAGDGKFDELQTLMQLARESSGDVQQEAWNQCFDLIAEEVPIYGLYHRELAGGYYANKISGYTPTSTTGLFFVMSQPL